MTPAQQQSPAYSLSALIEAVNITLLGGFLLFLYFKKSLTLFVRPDYFLFTLVIGTILMVIGIANVAIFIYKFIQQRSLKQKFSFDKKTFFQSELLLALLILGIFMPHRSLSANAAITRGIDQNILTGTSSVKPLKLPDSSQAYGAFIAEKSKSFTIADWVSSLAVNPEPEDYRGKPVSIDGFIKPNSDGTFTVARFVISCCAVDATPIGLPVDKPIGMFKADDWVHVEGKISIKDQGGKRNIIVVPDSITNIQQPQDPYLY